MKRPLRTSVLISGNGSNLQALIDARDSGRLDVDIVHVISNVAAARGLERAERAGIATSVLEHGGFADRDDFVRIHRAVLETKNRLIVLRKSRLHRYRTHR